MSQSLLDAYAANVADKFYPGHFNRAEDWERIRKAVRPVHPQVADVIELHNGMFSPSPSRTAHLKALRDGAPAVVTGQQMGLFLGPLFTIYKAATAINVAKLLAARWRQPVVPVFWLQTEDHDLPEIASCHVPSRSGGYKLLAVPANNDHVAVAHRTLPVEVFQCLAALQTELANLPYGNAHVEHLARHYRPGEHWHTAFSHILADLFAAEGLVLVNPRDKALAAHVAPVHQRALLDAKSISDKLNNRGRQLHAAGFVEGVHIRPGSPLSFVHPQGPDGPRYRLGPATHGFTEVGGAHEHSLTKLIAQLEAEPMSFSSSALLRPIIQDTLLPTVAYIAGPAEVAYFAQLQPLYESFNLPMPLVVPRMRLRLIEARSQRTIERLGLNSRDIALSVDDILARSELPVPSKAAMEELKTALQAPFQQALQRHLDTLLAPGHDMLAAVDKTRAAVDAALRRLLERYERTWRHRDESRINDIQNLKTWLYPNNIPQERFYGAAYFLARYGERAWIETILDASKPFVCSIEDVTLT